MNDIIVPALVLHQPVKPARKDIKRVHELRQKIILTCNVCPAKLTLNRIYLSYSLLQISSRFLWFLSSAEAGREFRGGENPLNEVSLGTNEHSDLWSLVPALTLHSSSTQYCLRSQRCHGPVKS